MKKELENAEKLYRQGKYREAIYAIDLATISQSTVILKWERAEAARIKAWASYYLAIKGDPNNKIGNAGDAVLYAKDVIAYAEDNKQRLSAYNVLPLALWISGDEDGAWIASDEALREFPNEPSAWNTRGILARWKKDYDQGASIGDTVTDKAVAKGDCLTAGHGQQNKGDALRALGRMGEAAAAYERALRQYRQHELSSGNSVAPHIASVEKKLAEIKPK